MFITQVGIKPHTHCRYPIGKGFPMLSTAGCGGGPIYSLTMSSRFNTLASIAANLGILKQRMIYQTVLTPRLLTFASSHLLQSRRTCASTLIITRESSLQSCLQFLCRGTQSLLPAILFSLISRSAKFFFGKIRPYLGTSSRCLNLPCPTMSHLARMV